MIELLLGLGGAVAVLSASLFINVLRTGKIIKQRDQAVAALDAISRSREAVKETIKQQRSDDESIQAQIDARDYFGG